MGSARMMNKKGAGTMTGIVISILITMALFYGLFEYTQANYDDAGITETLGYNQSYADIQTLQNNLSDNLDDIKSSVSDITEADSNVALIAWNSVTGIAAVIRLFMNVINVGISVFDALLPALSFFPAWVKILMQLGILVTIVMIVLGAFKGEANS